MSRTQEADQQDQRKQHSDVCGTNPHRTQTRITRHVSFVSTRGTLTVLLTLVSCWLLSTSSARAETPPQATAVLVFGDSDNGYERDNMAATLSSFGLQVDDRTSLPASLTGYRSVWDVDAYSGLSTAAQSELIQYLQGGGSLYLTGERPCCEALNASDQNILLAVLNDQSVTVGGQGDIAGPFAFNGDAIDGITSTPNLLTDFLPDSPGGMSSIEGVSGPNVLASSESIAVGGVWDENDMTSGEGRVVLLMDIDWLGSTSRGPIIQNIENFLDHGLGCAGSATGELAWSSDSPSTCKTLITPSTVSWGATSTGGNAVSFNVTGSGVTTSCVSVVGGTSATDTCDLSDAAATGGTVTVTATDAFSTVTRTYRVVPQNDPRNVPPGAALDSNWWTWPDSDGDGIPDYWEENGVWIGNKFLNLPAMGADPHRKDLFVHYDYLDGHAPSQAMIDDMTGAFAAMPLSNPDGSRGVALHVEVGSDVPASIGGNFELSAADIQKVTTYTGFASSPEFGGEGVPQLFKWMFNKDSNGDTIGAAASLPGFFAWTGFDPIAAQAALKEGRPSDAADAFAEASNAVHELGHLLGLHHHGAGNLPANDCRYMSVMSYCYSNFGVPTGNGTTAITYSTGSAVNYDYRVGPNAGELDFVPGQYGEVPNFYALSDDQTIKVDDQPETESLTESLQGVSPTSITAYSQEFGVEASPDIPTLQGASASVVAGQDVDIRLASSDPGGAPVAYEVVGTPSLGSASSTLTGIRYIANPGSVGTDTVDVRATNGAFSSDPVVVTIVVDAPSTAPPSTASGTTVTPPSAMPPPVAPASRYVNLSAELRRLLRPSGRGARLRALLRADGYTFRFRSLASAMISIEWVATKKGRNAHQKRIVVATVTKRVAAGRVALHVKLTTTGRRVFRSARSVRITSMVRLTTLTAQAALKRTTFVLRR